MLTLTRVACVVSQPLYLSSLLDTYIDSAEPDVAEEQVPATIDTKTSPAQALTPATTFRKVKKAADAGPPPASSPLTNLIAATSPVKKGSAPPPKGIFGIGARLVVVFNTLSMPSSYSIVLG